MRFLHSFRSCFFAAGALPRSCPLELPGSRHLAISAWAHAPLFSLVSSPWELAGAEKGCGALEQWPTGDPGWLAEPPPPQWDESLWEFLPRGLWLEPAHRLRLYCFPPCLVGVLASTLTGLPGMSSSLPALRSLSSLSLPVWADLRARTFLPYNVSGLNEWTMSEPERCLAVPGQPESVQASIDSAIKLMFSGSNAAAAVNEAVGELGLSRDTGRNRLTEYKQSVEDLGQFNLSPAELLLNTGLRYLPATFLL